MNRAQVSWSVKQEEKIKTLEEDLKAFRGSTKEHTWWESRSAVELEANLTTSVKLIWFDRQTLKKIPVKLETKFSGTEIFDAIESILQKKVDRECEILNKFEQKDVVRTNCNHAGSNCENCLCAHCTDFELTKSAEDRILEKEWSL